MVRLPEANTPMDMRLCTIYDGLDELLERYHPTHLAVEELFFTTNQKTAIFVGQARGIVLLAARKHNLILGEYTPLQVKQSVVGYGKAEKKQVMEMVRLMLGLRECPRPDDAADALAVAICHAHSYSSVINSAVSAKLL